MNTSNINEARHAKSIAKVHLADVPGVEVAGLGLTQSDGGYAVKVNLAHSAPKGSIPDKLNGVPLIVEVVGTVAAL
ncbi:hypothetical protein OU994_17500 [Pseudoduganella sp. SL102]|uniref:hypothetical protein n=1 Tax=Pseudoduganella sp. SL102 TaxID=2995154 RepID=UPI00248C781E|nr:hypothetical protein [Pseudoduganella sp. SL102]WBS00119.1 hypothetical protein OU994_17500 [Pseudoduganella sp. SL102]